jgi:23S rRNA (adenine2503-C2)-methyltransferase
MLNWPQVKLAINKLYKLYPKAQLLLSTVGINDPFVLDEIIDLSIKIPTFGLQFSLHESSDSKRNLLIPFPKKLSLSDIAKFGKKWHQVVGRPPFLNYIVTKNNSSLSDVNRLLALFDPHIFPITLSVLCETDKSKSSLPEKQFPLIDKFQALLIKSGYKVRVFNPAGQDDIGGGCGQLWFVQEKLKQLGRL